MARLRGRDGFTLIEALAAFAIVAILTLVVQRGLVQSRLGLAAIEDRTAAERVARSLLAEPLRLADVQAGGRTGIRDGRRFEIRLSPLDLPLPKAERTEAPSPQARNPTAPGQAPPTTEERYGWQPLREEIEVATARGASVSIETIRLGPLE